LRFLYPRHKDLKAVKAESAHIAAEHPLNHFV